MKYIEHGNDTAPSADSRLYAYLRSYTNSGDKQKPCKLVQL